MLGQSKQKEKKYKCITHAFNVKESGEGHNVSVSQVINLDFFQVDLPCANVQPAAIVLNQEEKVLREGSVS